MQRGLLADDHQVVRLGRGEPGDADIQLQIVSTGHRHVEVGRDERRRIGRRELDDLGSVVALVDDPVKRDIAEPAGRLHHALQPHPVLRGVHVGLTQGFGLPEDRVVNAAVVNLLRDAEAVHGVSQPGADAMIRRGHPS